MQPSLEQEIQELESRLEADGERDGRAFVPLADAYRRAGSLDLAAELVEEWLDRYPDLTAGHLVAGRIFRERDDAEAAERAYRRVLDLEGDHAEALRALASMAEDDGRDAEARDLHHRWALADPDDDRAREGLRRLKRRHFQELLEEEPREDEDEGVRLEGTGPEAAPRQTASAAPEPEESAPDREGERAPTVYTRTMAELYARQGLAERAAEVYRRLLEESPDDDSLRERLEALEPRRAAGAPPGSAAAAATADREVRSEEEIEDLARDWATGPDETGSLDSPFAWGEEEAPAGREQEVREKGPSAAAYFERLLREQEEEPEPREEVADEDGDATGEAALAEAADDVRDADDADPLANSSSSDDFRRWLEDLGP